MEINNLRPLFPLYWSEIKKGLITAAVPVNFAASLELVWGRFGATCGPQKPSREKAAVEPGIRKENGEESERHVGGKTTGEPKRTKVERTGENRTQGRGRKGKETGEDGGGS